MVRPSAGAYYPGNLRVPGLGATWRKPVPPRTGFRGLWPSLYGPAPAFGRELLPAQGCCRSQSNLRAALLAGRSFGRCPHPARASLIWLRFAATHATTSPGSPIASQAFKRAGRAAVYHGR